MTTKIYQGLATVLSVLLVLFGSHAQAAISCSLNSSGFASAYVSTNPGINITPTSFRVTCTRGIATDATSETVTVRVDNGSNRSGTQNRAASGATNKILYDNYIDAVCNTVWKNTSLSATVNMTGFTSSSSQPVMFWGCVPAGQAVPAGTYTDTVTLTPTFSNGSTIGSAITFPVSIVTPASCTIAVAPGNVAFGYTAFQTSAAQSNTTFSANCTNQLPYQLALDGTPSSGIYPGVISGLNYALSIGTSAYGAAILSTTSQIGSGSSQTYYINGVMTSGQAGTCASASCTGSDPRSLTITY